MRLQKLLPFPQKSASYDPWRMGLRWFFEFFVDLGPKNDFHQFAKMILHYEVDVKFAQGGPSLIVNTPWRQKQSVAYCEHPKVRAHTFGESVAYSDF